MKTLLQKLELFLGKLIVKSYIYRHIVRIVFILFPVTLFLYYYFSNNIEKSTYILLYFSSLMVLFIYSEFFRLVFTIDVLTFSFSKNGKDIKVLNQDFKEPNSNIIYINSKYPYKYCHKDMLKIQSK